ncbi:DUF1405 domain-containing protein [Thermoflavimicrobium daqui]|uniref:DUF1405 domain-containing protein n=1 Tax=Thermoflavimicrobium daqui TaxID=2137476 RepID=A0A364K0P6_9BACL|nr:DUF1405 domain-containing protein [Thermoflavimicrobium daqui]RAL21076.1 DUF1405 domain-containing protein [Thermoflavimicrobium daqui]
MIRAAFNFLQALLQQRWCLWILFWVNLLGSLYGFYWYKDQLAITPSHLLIFVPDSPTASAAFTLVLLFFLIRKKSPFTEAFAAITLFKYGIWAVVMIIWGGILDPQPFLKALSWQHWMLIASHLGMAAQAILYAPRYSYRLKEVIWVSAWTLLNDAMDYGLDIHPWVHPAVELQQAYVAFFTVMLSLISIALFVYLRKIRTSHLSSIHTTYK